MWKLISLVSLIIGGHLTYIIYNIHFVDKPIFIITEYSQDGLILNTIYSDDWEYGRDKSTLIVKDYYSNDEYLLKGTCQISELEKIKLDEPIEINKDGN